MKKCFKSIFLIFTTFILAVIIYDQRYNLEFKYHVFGYDKKLFDGDFLHPAYAYLKNNKLIGIEYISNPECGKTNRKYFFDDKENLNRIIYEIDFFSKHCDEKKDSLYIIKRENDDILIHEKNGGEINNVELEKMMSSFNLKKFKTKIKTWK